MAGVTPRPATSRPAFTIACFDNMPKLNLDPKLSAVLGPRVRRRDGLLYEQSRIILGAFAIVAQLAC